MNLIENPHFQTAVYAGFSLVMAYWLLACSAFMGKFCWDHRSRIKNILTISDRERADLALNWGLFGFFLYAAVQRSTATYQFVNAAWSAKSATVLAPFYLPVGILALSAFMWWACFHLFSPKHRFWWCFWMWSAAGMFAVLVACKL